MLKNKNVKGILVNIFGGIMKCDTIATGVITACKAVNLSVPLVVRMKGTNEELGKKMLAESACPSSPPTPWPKPPPRSLLPSSKPGPLAEERTCHLHQQRHQGHHPGHHGQDRSVPHRKCQNTRTARTASSRA